jgi:hypothetical protein
MNPLLKANRHILSMLKERLNQLEEKASSPVNTEKTPSQGQAYFYRSEVVFEGSFPTNRSPVRSVLRTEQDASFIATDFYLIGIYFQESFKEGQSSPNTFQAESFIKLVNASSGREITVVKGENLAPGTASELPSLGIPRAALTPLYGYRLAPLSDVPFSTDYNYKFPVEYQIPRGATIEAMVEWAAGSPYYRVGLDFVLGGYKVFGA